MTGPAPRPNGNRQVVRFHYRPRADARAAQAAPAEEPAAGRNAVALPRPSWLRRTWLHLRAQALSSGARLSQATMEGVASVQRSIKERQVAIVATYNRLTTNHSERLSQSTETGLNEILETCPVAGSGPLRLSQQSLRDWAGGWTIEFRNGSRVHKVVGEPGGPSGSAKALVITGSNGRVRIDLADADAVERVADIIRMSPDRLVRVSALMAQSALGNSDTALFDAGGPIAGTFGGGVKQANPSNCSMRLSASVRVGPTDDILRLKCERDHIRGFGVDSGNGPEVVETDPSETRVSYEIAARIGPTGPVTVIRDQTRLSYDVSVADRNSFT
ncbi:hypothetical protein JI739_00250 [Ramlibacter sp. AW1]|uniref:Uncharacterized protein n=1 Tax=Ramlibacter aurantiacus TaxID=2801330 RepID=A0A937D4C9_9BURK|nr:hypothetical protein [Ramlibacter aurantiacus]MBL0418763.1 hypothetical protein [Ramlibacter aurantiacus]